MNKHLAHQTALEKLCEASHLTMACLMVTQKKKCVSLLQPFDAETENELCADNANVPG